MDIHELRAALAALLDEMQAMLDDAEAENRDLTDDEQVEYDQRAAEADVLERRIERLQRARERRGRAADLNVGPREQESREARRITDVQPAGEARDFASLGEFLFTVRFRPADPRLYGVEQRQDTQVMGSGVHDATDGPLGGFAVPEQFRAELLEVAQQIAVIRPRAFIIPAGSPPDAVINMPALDQTATTGGRYGGVEVSWIEEAAEKPQTDARLLQVTLQPHELAASLDASDKLLRNWAAADGVFRRLLAGATVSATEFAFLSGTGGGQPTGIIGSDAEIAVNRATANQIEYEDVAAMYAALLMGGTPVWLASQSILPQLLTMEDNGGRLIFQPGIREGVQPQLLGFPIIWNERSPALGTKGDLILADLQYYLIKDGSGPFVAASEHVKFRENQTVIKIFLNVDGKPWLTEPIALENGYEVSPFVVLDVPTG